MKHARRGWTLFSCGKSSIYSTQEFHTKALQLRETKAERRANEMLNAQKKYALWTDSENSLLEKYDYVPTIGLEVHAQIKGNSKLFSSASTLFNHTQPNSHISHIDVALPGSLPILNEYCVRQAIKTAHALNGQIQLYSQFDRKHYFYHDMPQGYQITQQFHPIMSNGYLSLYYPENTQGNVRVRIQRLQIEQDSGKSMHEITFEGKDKKTTMIDLNRAGIGLIEIITGPDLHSIMQVEQFLKRLQFLLRHIGTCEGNMEEGNMRCDVNVSVAKRSASSFGVRCEIKNVISFNNVCKAIDYEIKRQIQVLESGGAIEQETRSYDAKLNQTILMRSKENAPDYRFIPDPDLPPLVLTQQYIDQVMTELPELPDQIIERLLKRYDELTAENANFLLTHSCVQYFEQIMNGNDKRNVKTAFNWLSAELFGLLNKDRKLITESPVSAENLASLVDCIQSELISNKIGKIVLQILYDQGLNDPRNAFDIVQENNWKQINDRNEIATLCSQVIQTHKAEVEKYLAGNSRLLSFMVGQVLKLTDGMANPQITTDIMKEMVDSIKK